MVEDKANNSVAAAATQEAKVAQISTEIHPLSHQRANSSKMVHSLRIRLAPAASTENLVTNLSNVSQIVLVTRPSARQSRETVKGADDSELGDPLLIIFLKLYAE